MSLSDNDVKKVAKLGALAISDNELSHVREKLEQILDFVKTMEAVNTDDITPMAHPLNMHQPLRDDAVTENIERDAYLALAPQSEAGLYLVPKVIENGEEES